MYVNVFIVWKMYSWLVKSPQSCCVLHVWFNSSPSNNSMLVPDA